MKHSKNNVNQVLYHQRESNYDLLRIICAITVIMAHVSHFYKSAITDPGFFGQQYTEHIVVILLYNILPRFSVPCFVMISGAFLLSDDRNSDYTFFYKKHIKKIGVPTIIFSLLYFLYSEALSFYQILTNGGGFPDIMTPLINFLKGMPFYHMWYLYTLIGIYALVPVLLNVKKSIGDDNFFKLSILLLIVSSISGWTSSFILEWSISKSICYIGYLMIGYQLRTYGMKNKNNLSGILLILLGIFTEFILTYIQYRHTLAGLTEMDEKYSIVGNFNPIVVIASLLIFAGFSKLNINYNLTKISSVTLYIYLFHAGILDLASRVIRRIDAGGDCRIIIPLTTLLTLAISYILSVAYTRLWSKIAQRLSLGKH